MELGLKLELKSELKSNLFSIIEYSNLLAVPDEVVDTIAQTIHHNPDTIEQGLQKAISDGSSFIDTVKKVRAPFPSLTRSKDSAVSREGIVTSLDLRILGDSFRQYQTKTTPDVTYIGRKNIKPKLVFSGHLEGSTSLMLVQVEPSKYPETSRLLNRLKRFDEWKRRTLKNVYIVIGEVQRDFLEDFDKARYNILTQEDLAGKIGISETSVSRLLSNRLVKARNVSGYEEILYAKDFLVTKDDLRRYAILPTLNKILEEEFEMKRAYSDMELTERIYKNLARRTITKYREASEIPSRSERDRVYKTGERTEPFRFK